MLGYDHAWTRRRAIATFALGLSIGVAASGAGSWTAEEPARIQHVAGDDSADTRSNGKTADARGAQRTLTPRTATPPPLVPRDLPEAASRATRNDAGTGADNPSPRVIAEQALGFTAFVRRGTLYGAGILLDSSGHVLTCRHVVEGDDRITISFHDTSPSPAELVESDAKLDIALLRIDTKRSTPAPVAPIASMHTGDDVFGMGAPHKLRFSMSRGLVSYVGRPFDELYYLQTDLPTNSGNSGGPVMNNRGEVVGVTTFIYRDSQGLAFALPIDYAFERFKHLLGNPGLDGTRFSMWQQKAKAHAKSGG